MVPLRILGSTHSTSFPLCEIIWSVLCFAILLMSLVAALITPVVTVAGWLTVSLPA